MVTASDEEILLKMASNLINGLLEGVSELTVETQMKVMEYCGFACANDEHWGCAIQIAKGIAIEETQEERILERANTEIQWCGEWVRNESGFESTCVSCGCLLSRKGIIKMTPTMCLCSRGWVKAIFHTLYGRPVDVELVSSIGRGDDHCKYSVRLGE